MIFSYYVSLIFTVITLYLSLALLSFGPCYNGCDWGTFFYSGRFLLPFSVTLAAGIMAIFKWHTARTKSFWHVVVLGLSGAVFLGLSTYAMMVDPGDAIVYSIFFGLGVLIGQPFAVFLLLGLLKRP